MKKFSKKHLSIFLVLIVGGIVSWAAVVSADSTSPVNVELQAAKYAAVKGDVSKFRALNWIKDGYSGGISDMSFDGKLKNGGNLSFEGRMIPVENDNKIDLKYWKDDSIFFKTQYQSFRKYYDTAGGVYSLFPNLPVNYLRNTPDLHLDMGNFLIEMGLGPMDDADLSLAYEQRTRKGAKSLLNWTPVVDSGTTKLIGPTWQSVDNTTDVFTLKGKKPIAGVLVRGEQKIEFDTNHTKQYKKHIDQNPTDTTNNKLRTEEDISDLSLYRTTLRGEKWTLDDRTFLSMGYHYQHTRASILDQLQEFKQSGVLFNYSSPRQSLPSPGLAREDEHVWSGAMHTNLTKNLAFISKFKYEMESQQSNFRYLHDTSTTAGNPNGVADRIDDFSLLGKNNLSGENFSLRYSGIARTSLYAEVDMEQAKDWISRKFDSQRSGPTSVAPGSPYEENRIKYGQRTSWAVGGRNVPSKYWTITTEVGQHYQDDHYNTVFVVGNPGDTLNALAQESDEAKVKVTWKPYRWLHNGFRYQFQNVITSPRAEDQADQTVRSENRMLASTYTYDVNFLPIDQLLLTLAYSRQNVAVKPISGSIPGTVVPGFNSGVNSWIFSSSYSFNEKVSVINTVDYSRADNFQNVLGTNGIPLWADYRQLTATVGLEWRPKKGMAVKPTYGYASYKGDPLVDTAKYSAHLFGLNLDFDW